MSYAILILCAACDGTGYDPSDTGTGVAAACPVCRGAQRVLLPDVADHHMYAFRDAPGIALEIRRRGCVAWVRDCVGAVMPGSLADIGNGCSVVAWVPAPESVRYEDEDEQELAELFRTVDRRRGRLPGLRSALSLVGDYYPWHLAEEYRDVIRARIAREEAAA